ncbi:hypothetical protein [Priestia aryabhattai]|uniref:hypothetical protein n=1 Tax=Priestia aryabhattai TaxID=412384 RepID=UPI001C8D1E75|nr:hypothetical protein [Priestia aryabhattai]MBY0214122.1 hypothetical protein [Priestia aryabhattai]
MNKNQFIEKAMETGLTMGEAFWLEMIYSKDGDKVTVDDNHQLMDFLSNPNIEEFEELMGLCNEYEHLVEQSKKDGTFEENQDYNPYFM